MKKGNKIFLLGLAFFVVLTGGIRLTAKFLLEGSFLSMVVALFVFFLANFVSSIVVLIIRDVIVEEDCSPILIQKER